MHNVSAALILRQRKPPIHIVTPQTSRQVALRPVSAHTAPIVRPPPQDPGFLAPAIAVQTPKSAPLSCMKCSTDDHF
ncbi:hypothetical protein EV356DRAFT_505313 [Viridothelium virens]|uniref:Uncharacterized protein n=1 Tax=Viridothelium virens TaxID=1048519 RepID=A0A6A6H498_VIRVR|nr:hypothetical protein EV356DRAFT_505313 [Viridothelium virens]